MASSVVSTATVAVNRTSPAQASMVAPFTCQVQLCLPCHPQNCRRHLSRQQWSGRVQCMQVWPLEGRKKFETLSYLPPLTDEQLAGEVEYLIRMKWIPCVELTRKSSAFVDRKNGNSPGYYDNRSWTMWKLPMFGCSEPAQVLRKLQEGKKAYPDYCFRIVGFDPFSQVQCISFLAYKTPGV